MLTQQIFFLIFRNQKFQFMIFTVPNDHFIVWLSSVTLTFNLPEQMFQINNCAKLFWNPCIKQKLWPREAQFMNIFTFDPSSVTLTLIQPTWTDVSNDNATPQTEELCQKILKSMHKCRSYGPDKLNL